MKKMGNGRCSGGHLLGIGLQRHLALALLSSSLLVGICGATSASAQQNVSNTSQSFSIRSQDLASAIRAFINATGWQVTYPASLATGKKSAGVSGSMPPLDALRRLVAGSDIAVKVAGPQAAALVAGVASQDAGAANDGSTVLAPIDITGASGASTEGTNSYTSGQVTVAGKLPVDVREVPNSVSVVTRKRLDDQNITTIEDALKQTTGVLALPYGGIGDGHFQARGYNLGIQYDGMPVSSGLDGMTQFDLAMYDRVEVLRGPAGLFQGASDIGGVVNLVRKRPMDEFHVNTGADYGSWNNKYGFFDVTGPLVEGGAVRGRAVIAGTDQDSFYDTKFNRNWTGYGIVEADLTDNTTLTLSAAHQEQKNIPSYGWGTYPDGTLPHFDRSNFPGVPWGVNDSPASEYYAEIKHTFDNNWQLQGSFLHRDQESTGYQAYAFSPIDPVTNDVTFATQNVDSRYDWNGADVHIGGPVELFGQEHQFVFGANYSYYLAHVGTSDFTFLPPVNIFEARPEAPDLDITNGTDNKSVQYGIYGQARIKITDPLTVVLGARLSNYKAENRNYIPSKSEWATGQDVNGKFTPYAGIVYDLNKNFSVYASYSDIFVPQTATSVGGGVLAPEQGTQYETGIKGQFLDGAINTSLSVFDIENTNRAISDPNNPDYSVASGKVRSRGIEAEVSGEIEDGWNLFAGYSYTHAVYVKDPTLDGELFDPRQPAHTFKLWTSYNFQDERLSKWTVGGGLRAFSKAESDSAPYIEQGAYAVFDAQVAYALNQHVKATLTVNNIFDKYYYERVGYTNWFNQVGAPRSFTVSLRSTF